MPNTLLALWEQEELESLLTERLNGRPENFQTTTDRVLQLVQAMKDLNLIKSNNDFVMAAKIRNSNFISDINFGKTKRVNLDIAERICINIGVDANYLIFGHFKTKLPGIDTMIQNLNEDPSLKEKEAYKNYASKCLLYMSKMLS